MRSRASLTWRRIDAIVAIVALLLLGAWFWRMQSSRAWATPTPDDLIPPPEWLTPFPTYPAWVPTATPTATATRVPTATPTPSPTRTPTPQPSPTPTLIMAALVADGNLYCREGPAPYYPAEVVLRPGDRAQVLGAAFFGPEQERYWFVALPDTRLCWVRHSDRFIAFEGPGADAVADLPVYPTPSPPEMAFTIAYAGPAECGGQRGWMFTITNYGTRPIESVHLSFVPSGGGQWPTYIEWWRDCQTRSGGSAIQPGHTLMVTTLAAGPAGQAYTATARVCAQDHFGEPCAEQTFSFRP